MKGIVFNLLERVVEDTHGEETWDRLLDDAGLEGAYTSLGSYPDDDFMRLVDAASSALDKPQEEIVRWFGRRALAVLAAKYPRFFTPHESTRPFLLTLNHLIHPEVRKLYPGADVPVFDFDTSQQDVLVMGYRSPRRLCSFAEGLVEGAAERFGEVVMIEQPQCMNRGDTRCLLRINLTP